MAKTITYNEELWKRGVFYRCTASSYYFSAALDSLEAGTNWHKAVLDCSIPSNAVFVFTYFAMDTNFILLNGKQVLLDSFIQESKNNEKEKKALFEQLANGRFVHPKDVLLTNAVGRYLWFSLEIQAGYEGCIRRLSFWFSVPSLVKLLPDCFEEPKEEGDFLHRFLSIFQTMYDTVQEEINTISAYFDPSLLDEKELPWLAEWVGSPLLEGWSEKIQRKWIQNSFSLIQKKGTLQGLSELLSLVTQATPRILETYRIMEFYSPVVYEENYRNLYGRGLYSFLVLFEENELVSNEEWKEEQLEQIQNLISWYKPAYTYGTLVLLKPYLILGQHCYLGINSTVSAVSAFQLDHTAVLPFQTALTKRVDQEEL